MRTRAILRLLAALFTLSLVAAACGEDDEPTTDAADQGTSDDESADGEVDHDDDHDHDDHDHDMGSEDMGAEGTTHDHGTVEVAAENAPTVDLEVFADPAGGVNIHVLTEDFTVAPEAASTDHVEGEGHFHLYVDGAKVLRFYDEWIHYAGVAEGDVEIAVSLNANDHAAYAVDGEEIRATVDVTVPEHDHGDHGHGEAEALEWDGDGVPTVTVEVVEDPMSGWNVSYAVDGMTLSPEHASGEHVPGEGHLHVYANGQKLGRLYGSATHLAALPDGEVEISVVAYANDHRPYAVDGQPISAATSVTVAS